MSALPGVVHRAWAALTLAWVAVARESAGMPCDGLCCALIGVMRKVTVQDVRRREMVLFVMQNKRHHDMGGRWSLFMKRICTVCHGKIHPRSVPCCMNVGFPHWKDSKIYLISILLFLFYLIGTAILFHNFLLRPSTEIRKEPCTVCLSHSWCRTPDYCT